ncbi:hypothetical protein, partial [Dickeya dianthicola]|uniref:hypothetical protein n=1 Tax=Dickeya dianthicola TaxID=204039 RepID=UPI001F619811
MIHRIGRVNLHAPVFGHVVGSADVAHAAANNQPFQRASERTVHSDEEICSGKSGSRLPFSPATPSWAFSTLFLGSHCFRDHIVFMIT